MPITIVSSQITNLNTLALKILGTGAVQKPIHLALVLDTSGSMEGDRISSVKRTLKVLIDNLRPDDKITVIGFSTGATTLLSAHLITADNKTATMESIDNLQAEGNTNMAAGIEALGRATNPDAVVILTDGQINYGITSAAGLISLVRSYVSTTPVYTLGYGVDHNSDLLSSISTKTNGSYTFIDNETMLPISIGNLLGTLQNEVAKSVKILIPDGGTSAELNSDNTNTYEIGAVVADTPVWAIFKGTGSTDGFKVSYEEQGVKITVPVVVDSSLDQLDLIEQWIRCEVSKGIAAISSALKAYNIPEAKRLLVRTMAYVERPDTMTRTLVIRMKAQLDELSSEINVVDQQGCRRNGVLGVALRANTSAMTYNTQRGVSNYAGDDLFSSPVGRMMSGQMASQYTQDPVQPAMIARS